MAADLERSALVVGAAFALPLNFLLFSLDNLLFLWFPSRIWATNPGDFQALGRNVLIILTKAIVGGAAAAGAFGLSHYSAVRPHRSGSNSTTVSTVVSSTCRVVSPGVITKWTTTPWLLRFNPSHACIMATTSPLVE